MLLINLFQFVYKQDQTGSKRFFNPFKYIFSKKCGKQHKSVVNKRRKNGHQQTKRQECQISGANLALNPYLHVLHIFSNFREGIIFYLVFFSRWG